MTENTQALPADYIVPMAISGLEGRMLRKPSPVKREILFIYGHHSSLERWWGLVEVFNQYGTVTMPDLPGFGGMDSFYTVGQKPTIDAMADYLAAFIKWRYKRKRLTIVGMSFGFAVATRMLQRYPELAPKVDMLVSVVGFAHHDDFTFTKRRAMTYRLVAGVFAHNPAAWLFRHTVLTAPILRTFYGKTSNAKKKLSLATSKADLHQLMDVEVGLWQSNDVRTYMTTTGEMLTLNNCHERVDLPVYHVSSAGDHFFDHTVIEQHMRVIFNDFTDLPTTMPVHAPSVIATAEMAAPMVPDALRRLLAEA